VVPGALRWGRRRTWGCGWWSAAWSASWRYKSGEQGRRTTGPRFAGDEDLTGGYYAFLFPSLPILLRLLGVFVVFGPDHDFTNSICLQQLLGVLCWVRP
jgi:hypothetical protein